MRRGSWHRMITAPPERLSEKPVFECSGCKWVLKTQEQLQLHKGRCSAFKATAMPADNDAAGWTDMAERFKRVALEAQGRGRLDEYEASTRRSDWCRANARTAAARLTDYDEGE